MIRPSYSLVTASTSSPVTYQEAAEHMRVDSDVDEDYIVGLLEAAREYVEGVTGRATLSASYQLTAPTWDSIKTNYGNGTIITPERSPIVSVASVKYITKDASTLTTIDPSNYTVMTSYEPGGIFFSSDYTLPEVNLERPDAIQIIFTAGFTTIGEVSPMIRHAIKILAAHWYENRLPVAPVNLMPVPMTLHDIIHNQRKGGMFS
jgi:uncharacterized phiE125 gp8 family phage protein